MMRSSWERVSMVANESQTLMHRTNIGMIIVASERPRPDEIIKHAGVATGSYAAELVERFYHFLVGRAIDVKKEYQDYYASEYLNVKEFLYQKYGLSPKYLRRLYKAIKSDAFIGLVPSTWGRDWQIESLMEYDGGMNVVMKALHAKVVENDDED